MKEKVDLIFVPKKFNGDELFGCYSSDVRQLVQESV
jgi:hypothetical protein